MGNIPPPIAHLKQISETDEFILLCKALNICVTSMAQTSQLQQNLYLESQSNKIPNSGRIILFTSAKLRNTDKLQDLLQSTIEECNTNIEMLYKNDKT